MKITDECISCGTCADSCPVGAIEESGDIYTINGDCTACRDCQDKCPVEAIVD